MTETGLSTGARLRLTGTGRGTVLVFAHGAGAGTAHPWYRAFAQAIRPWAGRLALLDFPGRAAGRRAPDRLPVMVESMREAANALGARRVLVGGRSMGGRVAAALLASGDVPECVRGGLAVGFPLAPPGRPEARAERMALLKRVKQRFAIVQGSRDPFGDGAAMCSAAGRRRTMRVFEVAGGGHGLDTRREMLVEGAAGTLQAALCWLEADAR